MELTSSSLNAANHGNEDQNAGEGNSGQLHQKQQCAHRLQVRNGVLARIELHLDQPIDRLSQSFVLAPKFRICRNGISRLFRRITDDLTKPVEVASYLVVQKTHLGEQRA